MAAHGVPMVFEWDSAKDAANQSKHGLSFALAARVFADPHRITLEDTDKTTANHESTPPVRWREF